jgi:hypothetical protein
MPSSRVGLCLPWPDKKLSPNARQHWAQRSSAVKRARSQAYLLTRGSMSQPGEAWDKMLAATPGDQINVRLTFEPPARYRYDIDNLVARMKSSLDGRHRRRRLQLPARASGHGGPAQAARSRYGHAGDAAA